MGNFLGGVRVPTHLLADGRYFQWQLPHVLADGTVVAFRLTSDGGAMLRLRHGKVDEVPLAAMFTPTYDDGTRLYGSVVGGPALATLDPVTGDIAPTRAYRLPSGDRFTFSDDFDRGRLEFIEGSTDVTLRAVTAAGAAAHVAVQFRAGSDDALHVFVTGLVLGPASPEIPARWILSH